MENKYYTPALEEFHVGFEYEYNNNHVWMHEPTKGEWKKEEYINGVGRDGESDYQEIMNMLDNDEVRVKHLNKEDIASFGFKQITDDCYHLPVKEFRGRLNQEVRILVRKTILIYLAMDITDKDNIVLFTGTIKNKSELKKLMNQLGIIKNENDE